MGHFDFSEKFNHKLKPTETSSPLTMPSSAVAKNAQSSPIHKNKSLEHVSTSAPTFSLQKQIFLHNVHIYEIGNSNLVHSSKGSKQTKDHELNEKVLGRGP